MPRLSRCFIDMDGVLVDFVNLALKIHDREDLQTNWPPGETDIHRLLNISKSDFWEKLDSLGASLWKNLPPYPWYQELIGIVESFSPWTILTSPSLNPECPTGKVQWMNLHLQEGFRNFLIGPQKHLLAQSDRVLIDDSDVKIDQFRHAGGKAILFPQPWNSNHGISDRMDYIRDELNRIQNES